MNPTIKRIVEERANDYECIHFGNSRSYIEGAEENAPMIYAQGIQDVLAYMVSELDITGAWPFADDIENHFKAALEHLAKDSK